MILFLAAFWADEVRLFRRKRQRKVPQGWKTLGNDFLEQVLSLLYKSQPGSLILCRLRVGVSESAKINVNPMPPHTLKLTQNSSVWVRQTNSFTIAIAMKKMLNRRVTRCHPLSVIGHAVPITILRIGLPKTKPVMRMLANRA